MDRVVLADESGRPLAVLEVERPTDVKEREAEQCFAHGGRQPGVAGSTSKSRSTSRAASPSSSERSRRFPSCRDPADTRRVAARGLKRVVGFQTRNPIHRRTSTSPRRRSRPSRPPDHPLVGETKSDDVRRDPRRVLSRPRRQLLTPRTVSSVAFQRQCARRPREAVWHAICRKNYGCSHSSSARPCRRGDNTAPTRAHDLRRLRATSSHRADVFEHAVYCKRCEAMVSPKTCPHGGDDTSS